MLQFGQASLLVPYGPDEGLSSHIGWSRSAVNGPMTVLIVDDQRETRWLLHGIAEDLGLAAVEAESGEEALTLMAKESVDLVLTDLRMPGMSGIELLQRLQEIDRRVPVVVCTAYGTIETAVEAMKKGAFDFLLKPFDLDAVRTVIRRALQFDRFRQENEFLRQEVDRLSFEDIVSGAAVMQPVYELIKQVAVTNTVVLITGETGTGKELVARAIHNRSERRDGMFVPLNCAAVPAELLESELFGHVRGAFTGAIDDRRGRFALADGGTLFLDEIGDMPLPLQAKLLRVLQERTFEPLGSSRSVKTDVRVISSTNRNLAAAAADGAFRSDLYYRLNVVHIEIPPLRERQGDVELLARHYLEHFSKELGRVAPTLSPAALQILTGYEWPGNVRELRNLMERAVVVHRGGDIDAASFAALDRGPAPTARAAIDVDDEQLELAPNLERVERALIARALAAAGERRADAARFLRISERALWYKVKKYKL